MLASRGKQAALQYDEMFRRWMQKYQATCPWQQKNAELYQEALVLGLHHELKSKKQHPLRAPLSIVTVMHTTIMPQRKCMPPPSRLSNLCRQTLSKILPKVQTE